MRKFGVEIEAVGMTAREAAELLSENGIDCGYHGYTHRVMNSWKVVTDASVSRGFEVVSPPLVGQEGIDEVRKVMQILNEAGCDVNKDCGLHVHIECADLTPQHICNIYNRYRKHEEEIDRFMPRSRRGGRNSYCKSLKRSSELSPRDDAQETTQQRPNRYYKVNLKSFAKYGTIEFRQHSGTLNGAKTANWIQFLIEFVEASRPVAAPQQRQRRVRGNQLAVLNALEIAPSTVNGLAFVTGLTIPQVKQALYTLKLKGYRIDGRGNGIRRLRSQQTTTPTTTPSSLWDGISRGRREYFARRAQILGA